MKRNDLYKAAVEVMGENQKDFSSSDPKECLLYVAAFNDGVLSMMDKLIHILGLENLEAADE